MLIVQLFFVLDVKLLCFHAGHNGLVAVSCLRFFYEVRCSLCRVDSCKLSLTRRIVIIATFRCTLDQRRPFNFHVFKLRQSATGFSKGYWAGLISLIIKILKVLFLPQPQT